MTSEEYQWHLRNIKEKYEYLNLTPDQSEEIYRFEEDKNMHSIKRSLSVWEDWEYEKFTFRLILTESQFDDYLEKSDEAYKLFEQNLIEFDALRKIDVSYNQKILEYYIEVFVANLLRDPLILTNTAVYSVKEKVTFLKSEYRMFLNDSKKDILIDNFRHNRLFTPNLLQASLLQHSLCYVWPASISFEDSADEGTKAVISYLSAKVKSFPPNIEALLTQLTAELNAYRKALFKTYYGEPHGWHVDIEPQNKEALKKEWIMQLLLLDKEFYGLKTKIPDGDKAN